MKRLNKTQHECLAAAKEGRLTRRRHGWANDNVRGFQVHTLQALEARGLIAITWTGTMTGFAELTLAGMAHLEGAS